MIFRPRVATAVAACCLLVAGVRGASLKLYPVRIVLSPDQPVETMTIHNSGTDPARIQLRVFAWRQADGRDIFDRTRDVLANPSIFEIPPGGDQIARFGLRTAPGAVEKSYRVFLQEVPAGRPRNPGEVKTLLRVSVPIFVPAPNAASTLEWRLWPAGARKVTLAIHNVGNTHVQIDHLELHGNGKTIASKDMSVYLLPGASQQITLDAATALGIRQAVTLTALSDQGAIATHLVSEATSHDASYR